jgi:peptidoglycan-associated lipoprotein
LTKPFIILTVLPGNTGQGQAYKETAMSAQSRLKPALLLACAALALSACASKAPKDLPPGPGPATGGSTGGGLTSVTPGSQADFVARMMGDDTIYFDTDRFNIDSADAAALGKQASWLGGYPAKQITIEGHADERGTREYNLALGERRANAAKNHLVGLGIDPARISTVSYGKERPLALTSSEEAWAQNRRAVTITVD